MASIAGPTAPNTYFNLVAEYTDQGKGTGASPTLSLPALTTITKADDGDGYNDSDVGSYAYNNGVISAPNLNTFDDNDSHPNSSINVASNGSVVSHRSCSIWNKRSDIKWCDSASKLSVPSNDNCGDKDGRELYLDHPNFDRPYVSASTN